jgi:hypothetical protein
MSILILLVIHDRCMQVIKEWHLKLPLAIVMRVGRHVGVDGEGRHGQFLQDVLLHLAQLARQVLRPEDALHEALVLLLAGPDELEGAPERRLQVAQRAAHRGALVVHQPLPLQNQQAVLGYAHLSLDVLALVDVPLSSADGLADRQGDPHDRLHAGYRIGHP